MKWLIGCTRAIASLKPSDVLYHDCDRLWKISSCRLESFSNEKMEDASRCLPIHHPPFKEQAQQPSGSHSPSTIEQ
jgi:hypothetical protein